MQVCRMRAYSSARGRLHATREMRLAQGGRLCAIMNCQQCGADMSADILLVADHRQRRRYSSFRSSAGSDPFPLCCLRFLLFRRLLLLLFLCNLHSRCNLFGPNNSVRCFLPQP